MTLWVHYITATEQPVTLVRKYRTYVLGQSESSWSMLVAEKWIAPYD